jgi:hypothetical protein
MVLFVFEHCYLLVYQLKPAFLWPVMTVACNNWHTVMVSADGISMLAFGIRDCRQLVAGMREHQQVPRQVSGPADWLEDLMS